MEWLNAVAAASYLGISRRQLDRVVPASGYIGRSPRWSKETLDAFVVANRRERVQISVPKPVAVRVRSRSSSSTPEWRKAIQARIQSQCTNRSEID